MPGETAELVMKSCADKEKVVPIAHPCLWSGMTDEARSPIVLNLIWLKR